MIVYFAVHAAEVNYILPIIKKTKGILVTDSKEVSDYVRLEFPFVKCYFDKRENLSNYCPEVVVLADTHHLGKQSKDFKLVQIFHGIVDKGIIYKKKKYKNPESILYKTSDWVEHCLPKRFNNFSLLSNNLWEPFKNLKLDRLVKNNFHLLCLIGKYQEKKFRKLNLLTKKNWKAIGFPRLDPVFNGELSKKTILDGLGLEPQLKTVLYGPTWRGRQEFSLSSIPEMGNDIFKSINENVNFIFKPHPLVKKYNEFPDIMKKLEEKIENRDNFVYPEPMNDIIPLMYVSDLLITDFSTVGIEYLAFDKPIIYIDHLKNQYNDTSLIEIWIREKIGDVVNEKNQLKKVIKRCLDNSKEKSKIRQKYRDFFFYSLDGKASKRAAYAILEL